MPGLFTFQVLVESNEVWLEYFQEIRLLGFLDFRYVKELPWEEGNWIGIGLPPCPGDPETRLCRPQNVELLILCCWGVNNSPSAVRYFDGTRCNTAHNPGKQTFVLGCTKVEKSCLFGVYLVIAYKDTNAPCTWEGGFGFVYNPIVVVCIVFKVYPKLSYFAHPEICINKQAFGYTLSAKSETGLYLIAALQEDLVHNDLAFVRAHDLKQDNCLVSGFKVTIRVAGHFAIEGVILRKVE